MTILVWLILGLVAGWIASMFMGNRESLVMDIVLGIVGAFVGGLVMNLFGAQGVTGFNLYSILVAALGAVVVIWLGRALRTA